jgi:hypothetical protein
MMGVFGGGVVVDRDAGGETSHGGRAGASESNGSRYDGPHVVAGRD